MVSFVRRHPFFPVSIMLMAGICSVAWKPAVITLSLSLGILIVLVIAALCLFLLPPSFQKARSQIVLLLAAFYFLGVSRHLVGLPNNQERHLIHFIEDGNNELVGQVSEVMKGRILLNAEQLNGLTTHGKILAYSRDPFRVGDRIMAQVRLSEIAPPKNPFAFDFKRFYHYKKIYHQANFIGDPIVIEMATGWASHLDALRIDCKNLIGDISTTENERALTLALTLGYKKELGMELKDAFADSGAMHVLAVSGLHVGVVYMLIMFLLRGLFPPGLIWRWCRSTLVLLGLWFFVYLVGAPISAWRAALMFSLFEIGTLASRGNYPINTLSIAAFVLLLIDSYSIFEVSFQLSFLAVLGIVSCQKTIQDFWRIENWLGFKLWQLVSLSLAAQIFTFPLSIYYFHQFPLYFWLSGLLAVPLAFILLSSTLVFLVLHWIPFIGQAVGLVSFGTAYVLNAWVFLLQELPGLTVEGLWINSWQVLLIFGMSYCVSLWLNLRKMRYLNYALISFICLLSSICYLKIAQLRQVVLIYYYDKKDDLVDLFIGQTVYPIIGEDAKPLPNDVAISRSAMGARQVGDVRQQNTVFFVGDNLTQGTSSLVILDSFGLAVPALDHVEVVLIRDPLADIPSIELGKNATMVLSSGQRRNDLESEKRAIHYIHEQGAFVLDLNR